MTASLAFDPQRTTGYRLEELAAAFDRVRDARDWKAPIQATIDVDEQLVVGEAVRWFTDTTPVFLPAAGQINRLLVRAAGYRLGPAGDWK